MLFWFKRVTYILNLCLKIDYTLIAEGQVCDNERSRFDRREKLYQYPATDLKVAADYDEIDECAQYCKSISNRFIFGKSNKQCYCHTGTREAGRCKMEANPAFDLYEFRYPGKFLSCAVTQIIMPGIIVLILTFVIQ